MPKHFYMETWGQLDKALRTFLTDDVESLNILFVKRPDKLAVENFRLQGGWTRGDRDWQKYPKRKVKRGEPTSDLHADVMPFFQNGYKVFALECGYYPNPEPVYNLRIVEPFGSNPEAVKFYDEVKAAMGGDDWQDEKWYRPD